MNTIICGVDISKAWLDAKVGPAGASGRFGNDPTGIAKLEAFCRHHGVELVVMEASGGYERLAFMMLWEKGQPCALVNARNVRRFAEAMGFLEKTDDIDAGVIAHYGEVKRVCPTQPPSPAQQRLKALVSRLSQVTGDLTINKQRRSAATDAETIASLDEIIVLLKRQQRRLEGEIASLIDDDPLWARLDKAFRQIKGVASRTVRGISAPAPAAARHQPDARPVDQGPAARPARERLRDPGNVDMHRAGRLPLRLLRPRPVLARLQGPVRHHAEGFQDHAGPEELAAGGGTDRRPAVHRMNILTP